MMSCHARAMFRETIVFLVASYGKIITCGLSTENPKVVNFMSAFKSLRMELVLTPQNFTHFRLIAEHGIFTTWSAPNACLFPHA